MNSQGFSFPPPPPPPPTQQSQYNQNQPATFPSQYGPGHHGQRGGRGGHHRGRGRGYGNRGGRGGSYMPHAANSSNMGYAPMNHPGYAGQPMANPQRSISTPQFPPSQTANYQVPQSTTSFPSSRPFPQSTPTHGPPYQHQPGYSAYGPSTAQQAPTYHSVTPSHQNAPPSVQPSMMGLPMHWGYNNAGSGGGYTGTPHGNQRGPRPYNAYGNQASRGGGTMPHMKRDHASAFGKPQSITPRVPAPPPVPSFGNPLPSKPPPPADATRKPKKKKRKHNQLGLTPKTEEHESSEEEDDVDEESRLAQGGAGAAAAVQFTFKGRTTTLQSPAEIAAWIEERKKRFPTKEKIEEKKKAIEEAKKAKEEAQRQKESRKQETKKSQKDHQQAPSDPIDAAEKAKRKADKLRRKLMKEQKKVEKAEADAERARMRVEELQRGSTDVNKDITSASTQDAQAQPGPEDKSDTAPDQETRASETQGELLASGHTPGQVAEPNNDVGPASATEAKPNGEDGMEDVKANAAVSSDISDSSDWTSSSGSDLSSSDSEDSDSDSAPEETTSRREGPERVAPPPREAKKKLCRHFARTGRCQRGDKCKFLHETPDRGAKAKSVEKKGRKGLLQALLDRQKGEDDRKVMEAIVWLGENGFLDETKSHVEALEGANENSAMDEVKSSQGLPGDPPLSSEDIVSVQTSDSAPATA